MRVVGFILPAGDGSGVNHDAWCRLVALRPEFRSRPMRVGINPLTREPMTIPPRPDVASVVVDGVAVGDVAWSMDEDMPLVNVVIEPAALPLLQEWAADLGGEFRRWGTEQDGEFREDPPRLDAGDGL